MSLVHTHQGPPFRSTLEGTPLTERIRTWFRVGIYLTENQFKCCILQRCVEKESPPHIKPENNQKITLHQQEFWSGCKEKVHNVTKLHYVDCSAARSFRSSRERWWFLAISRCQNSTTKVTSAIYPVVSPHPHGGSAWDTAALLDLP